MKYYTYKKIALQFGNAQNSINPAVIKNDKSIYSTLQLLFEYPFKKLNQHLPCKSLVLLHQVHGNKGLVIHSLQDIPSHPFLYEGDFLVTSLKHIALGITTADCLPIIFYDPINEVIGVTHAGWRGAVEEVAIETLKVFQRTYTTALNDIWIFFGPAAQPCCYRVGDELIKKVRNFSYGNLALRTKNFTPFFDLTYFNQQQLIRYGVPLTSFKEVSKECTICNPAFCSYRRNPQSSERQISIVSLI